MISDARLRRYAAPALQMAPMIDVVFLLLVFFLIVTRPVDILSHLDVSRPRIEGGDRPLSTLRIEVLPAGHVLNGKPVSLGEMDRVLERLSGYSKHITVVITCAPDSPHDGLVQALNLCSKNGLKDLSLVSR